ncbi:MAG: Aquaporin Z [uncultured Rubrobacteraceae bacterium]|uniref:Aquaporin Z n=1 Tax=uncultured Rubrobacteraceae bacterium TaxID=349277 RepID=A0A6J4QVY5_9ACTN|nr:MAG: Aquaporin Z [uncultured Rubrobacteraceae bacterium]
MDSEGNRREEGVRPEAGQDRTTGRPAGDEGRGLADGPTSGVRRAGSVTSRQDTGGGRLTRDEMRRAAKEGLIEREEELKGDGLYGSSTSDPIMPVALAELVGTFILVFGGTAVAVGAILSRPTAGAAYDSLAIALAFGLALAAVVAAIGHVSGAHVNPAVTLGMASTGKFPWKSVPIYLGAQLVGAVLGALGTWLAFGGPGRIEAKLAATYPAQGVGDLQAFLLEILITFILVFVVISVATDDRAPAPIAPVAVGFALAVGVFIAGPVTGGAVNPVRALGPMLVAGDLTSAWLYILGPIIGGVLAALLYDRTMAQS